MKIVKSKVLCILIFSLLITSVFQQNSTQAAIQDSISNHIYKNELLYAIYNGLMPENVNPNDYLTKGAACQSLNALLGAYEKYEKMDDIKNIKKSNKYYESISIGLKCGYLSLKQNGDVSNPNSKATYSYINTIFSKALGLQLTEKIIRNNSHDDNLTYAEFAVILYNIAPNIIDYNLETDILLGDTYIVSPNITISNTIIEGNLIITDGIGNQALEIINVSVQGDIIIRGGTDYSINLKGTTAHEVRILKENRDNVIINLNPIIMGTDSYDGFSYTWFSDDTVSIYDYYGEDKDTIIIPEEINNMKVTAITERAFYGLQKLNNVSIPKSVTKISKKAFSNTPFFDKNRNKDNLVIIDNILVDGTKAKGKVKIPNNVIGISDYALEGSEITSINVPSNVKYIGDYAYYHCAKLKEIKFEENLESIGKKAFMYCALEDVKLPDSIRTIGESAFHSCGNLSSVYLPKNIKVIPEFMFWGCENLTKVTIPEGIECISYAAFMSCKKLSSLILPDSLKGVNLGAFISSNITNLEIPSGVTSVISNFGRVSCLSPKYKDKNGLVIVNGVLIDGLNAKGDIIIPKSVKEITSEAFGCYLGSDSIFATSKITSIIIPSNVEKIGSNAFNGCQKLKSVELSEGLRYIGSYAFSSCDNLLNINLPNSLIYIGEDAFKNTPFLNKIRDKNGLSIINGILIEAKESNGDIVIPNKVHSIAGRSFYWNTKITSIKIPKSVKKIGEHAFAGCNNLKSVNISEGLEVIAGYAFAYCSKLEKVTLPKSLKVIGDSAFQGTPWYDNN